MLWEEGGEESSFPSALAPGEPAKEQSVRRTKVRALKRRKCWELAPAAREVLLSLLCVQLSITFPIVEGIKGWLKQHSHYAQLPQTGSSESR